MNNCISNVYGIDVVSKMNLLDPLTLLCIKTLAAHWIERPVLMELKFNKDIYALLKYLPVNLPLEMTIERIHDDLYWKRCFKNRWKTLLRYPLPVEKIIDYEKQIRINEEKLKQGTNLINSIKLEGDNVEVGEVEDENEVVIGNDLIETVMYNDSKDSLESKLEIDFKKSSNKRNTWKQYYIERHIEDFLENSKPEDYDHEQAKKLFEICEKYINKLEINKLQAPLSANMNRIPLNLIFCELSNVSELSICFKQANLIDSFSWHLLNTTKDDVKNMSKGLAQMNLLTLRILNSDIDNKKLEIIINTLKSNDQLNTLDLSHCKISDPGISTIAEYFENDNNLESLNLSNNFIGETGAKIIANALKQPNCKLQFLDLSLNNIGPNGGNFLAVSLIKNTTLRKLLLAAGGLTKENHLIPKIIRHNRCMEYLNLSNNCFEEEFGIQILEALSYNNHLTTLDVRMCKISLESEFQIKNLLQKNRSRSTKVEVRYNINSKVMQENALDLIEMYEKHDDYFKDE